MPLPSRLLATLLLGLAPLAVLASPASDALGSCLADSTTGKDRKDLARWVFVAMATHPDLRDLSGAIDPVRDQTSQSVAKLFTRLLSESCAPQTRAAIQSDGSEAIKSAFGSLGQLAMQELLSNKQVAGSISGFEKYIDRKKLEPVLAPR